MSWRHVPTDRNTADIGSRGCSADKIPAEWRSGPSWIQCQQNWPPDITTESTVETESNHQNDKILKKAFIMESFKN